MYVQYYSSVVVEITLYGYLCYYHILSTNLTHTVARTFCQSIRADGETLEHFIRRVSRDEIAGFEVS